MSDFPNPPFPYAAFGSMAGQTAVGGSPTQIINGLTISQYMTVMAPSGNKSNVWIGDSHVVVGGGFPIAPGGQIILDTGLSASRWFATTDGITAGNVINYISRSDEAGS